jgi:mitogen-activated protein kinase kinase kinase 7
MAPEIFNNEPYTLKADVYSFGIVLWEIAARKPPYLHLKNPQALMRFITVENGRPDLSELGGDCPSELVKLMTQCWDRSP